MKTLRPVLFLCLTTLLPLEGFAAAFLIYNQDARANGMGMAVASSVNNPSAVFYNPAMLVHQTGFAATAGDTVIIPETSYRDPSSGSTFYAKAQTHHLPHIFARYTGRDISLGIGIFSPFGLSTEWPEGWPGRYASTFAEIKTAFINPVIAFKANDSCSIGFGISYVLSSVQFKNAINLSALGLPDGLAKLAGNGNGFGYNGAITFKLPEDFTLSLTYRSPVQIKYEGKARFYLPFPLPSSYTGASTRLTLPFVAAAGIAKTMGPLVVEADILYTGWSSLSNYRITSDNGRASQFVYKNWYNTPSIAVGANYRVNEAVELRCGYMFDKSPVPKKTMGPELPDSTRHILTFGAAYQKKAFKIDIGYQATFFTNADSSMTMSGPRGSYNNFAHLILFGVTYSL
jgi:long-chain fatty acid transport protein